MCAAVTVSKLYKVGFACHQSQKKAAPAAKSEAEMDALAKSIDASMTMSKLTDAQRDIVKAKMFLGFRMGGGAYAYITT